MNKFSFYLTTILLLFMHSSTASADRVFIQLEKTIEEARITVKPNQKEVEENDVLGTLTATYIDCPNCQPQTFAYTKTTQLTNQFGAEKPIDELASWNGNRALIRYYIESKQIKLIEILP